MRLARKTFREATPSSGCGRGARAIQRVIGASCGCQRLRDYGLTETHGSGTWTATTGGDPLESCGRVTPVAELTFRPDSEAGEGEILISGPSVSPGYWGQEPRSRSAPLATGDLGNFDAEGHLYVTGRVRDVVTIAGRRVSPEHVAQVLARHPRVADAIASGVLDPLWGERVAAAVVASARLDRRDLNTHCRTQLKPYEIPRKWAFIDEIPLASSGKPDLSVLRRLVTSDTQLPAADDRRAAPQRSATIWTEFAPTRDARSALPRRARTAACACAWSHRRFRNT